MECFKCGVSGDRALLFNAISEKGIVKICRKCSFEEEIPIIKKFDFNHAKPEIRPTVRQRLSNMSGVEMKSNKTFQNKLSNKQDSNLREIANKNFESKIRKEAKPRNDLVNNFHWVIMRVRRSKKITQKQLAEAIEEPEAAINMAEQGILPEGYKLVNKLENYLGIKIVKGKVFDVKQEIANSLAKEEKIIKQEQSQIIDFDSETTKTLTISDLQEMKRKKESEILEGKEEGYIFNKDISPDKDDEEKPEFVEKENLSQEEVDDILFGRKGR